jgi:glucose dehydrogenase
VVWQFKSPRNIHGRGLAYWKGTGAVGPRLFFGTDKGFLMALDLKTGKPAVGFGANGEVDAYVGVVSPTVGETRRDTFTLPNPVTVFRNLIITGARPGEDEPPQPRGDIRAWDAATGKLVWSFHAIPRPGEPNHEDWPGETWKDRSGCIVYSNLTADESTGLVFGATGEGNKAVASGKNLYCNSIIALDAATGRLKWFQQLIHRDANSWDMPTPPVLINVRRAGRTIPAVLQSGKTRFNFIFDRVTGEPLYGIEERPVLGATGDVYPTQPVPVRPAPSGRMSVTRSDLNRMTPEIEEACAALWDERKYQDGAPYARSTPERPIVQIGGSLGHWAPLAYDDALGYVFQTVVNAPGRPTFRTGFQAAPRCRVLRRPRARSSPWT